MSKLESLPNEILTDILEKYTNGVDLLRVFSFQLNQRFDALITQCQRVRFDFIQCQKDDFRFCMELVPAYLDKIEELAISEQDTPGQVNAFLSLFPSFELFKQLRTLYIHFDDDAIDWRIIERALNSLSQTAIETLSIKSMNADSKLPLGKTIVDLFRLNSLKRLSLTSVSSSINWTLLARVSSNVQHLAISGIHFLFQDLQYIFKCAPYLKYLDVELNNKRSFYYDEIEKSPKNNITLMSTLRTLVLYFQQCSPITMDMLKQYFNSMPYLNRLEIKAHSRLLDANAWQMLLETSLPLLNHFSLRTTTSRVEKADLHNVLASFQSLYWLQKKNFNIMITDHAYLDINSFNMHRMKYHVRHEFDLPVIQYWIVPDCIDSNNLMIVNNNINLRFDDTNSIISHHYYFANVKCLIIDHMESSIFKWMTTHVNYCQITQLVVVCLQKNNDALAEFLACLTNITSLYINFDVLMASKDGFLRKSNSVKHLDTSLSEHQFDEDDIITIAKCFPYVEHLTINTTSLHSVPLLNKYLVHLRSLTFDISKGHPIFYDNYDRKRWKYDLRQTNCFFQVKNDTMTLWLDQTVFAEPYWQRLVIKRSQSTASSVFTTTSKLSVITKAWNNQTKKKSKFSFFDFFK